MPTILLGNIPIVGMQRRAILRRYDQVVGSLISAYAYALGRIAEQAKHLNAYRRHRTSSKAHNGRFYA